MTSTTDLVAVLPGIMGSTLQRHGATVWAPSGGAILRAIATFGASITGLRLPEGIGDGHPHDGVLPVGLMPDLHALPGIWTPVKGYNRLLDRLRGLGYRDITDHRHAPPGNLLPFPYDWRLSCRYNAHRLAATVEPALERWRSQGGQYAEAQLVLVCHSMGGLIARWYLEHWGGADLTRKLILLGTPHRGALKALRQLVNGVPPALGRLADDLNGFARSLPSIHQLLPEYACLEHDGGLHTLADKPPPQLDTGMVHDAMTFHTRLRQAEAIRPAAAASTHLIVGVGQPTATTARLAADQVIALDTYLGDDLAGDATVPLPGATPAGTRLDSNTIRRIADKHGNLQRNRAALDEIESVITSKPILIKAPPTIDPRVDVPELLLAGQPVPVEVTLPPGQRVGIRVTVTDEHGNLSDARTLKPSHGRARTEFTDLPPGGYTIDVTGVSPGNPIAPVSSDLLIWTDPPG
jgi:alpha-beta hydrolase superfamily lysophospholipase